MKKTSALVIMIVAIALTVFSAFRSEELIAEELKVYHSKFCGCCKKWISHMEANGFKVKSFPVDDMNQIKSQFNVPANLSSCHTAVIGKYMIEGHVPAAAVKKLLRNKSANISGLAVPGMPVGSPGMEANYIERYNVLSFTDTRQNIFMSF